MSSHRKYYVYILQCFDKTLYVGSTNNLKKRLTAHNTSKYGAHYTKTRRPVVLVYSENCKTLSNALKREHALKQLTRKEKLDIIRASEMSRRLKTVRSYD